MIQHKYVENVQQNRIWQKGYEDILFLRLKRMLKHFDCMHYSCYWRIRNIQYSVPHQQQHSGCILAGIIRVLDCPVFQRFLCCKQHNLCSRVCSRVCLANNEGTKHGKEYILLMGSPMAPSNLSIDLCLWPLLNIFVAYLFFPSQYNPSNARCYFSNGWGEGLMSFLPSWGSP